MSAKLMEYFNKQSRLGCLSTAMNYELTASYDLNKPPRCKAK